MSSTLPDAGPGAAGDTGLPPQLDPILHRLPPEDRNVVVEVIRETSHSGPICSPADLARYEEVLPGLAERIVRLPEREQEHRHRVVEGHLDRDFRLRRRGQTLAISGLILLLIFAGLLAFLGHPDWAGSVAIGTIVGVVGIFVTGRWFDRRPDGSVEEP